MAKPKIAIMYDVDKTLCTKDMQEYTFIPGLDMAPEEFWNKATILAKDRKMDRILAYMYTMLDESRQHHKSIKREQFVNAGNNIDFFPGVDKWFDRINEFGRENGASIEHYIISSGLKEIIEGSKLKNKFKAIFASEFYYDVDDIACWPRLAVNYTAKTQFLFRINKGVLDISDDDTLNKYTPEDEREIPFRNMIYIGDGLTDVPCMRLVKAYGGYSIAVYRNRHKSIANELLTEGRVNFIMEADYSEDKPLDATVKKIIQKITISHELINQNIRQVKTVKG